MTMQPDALSEKFRQWALLKQQNDATSKRMNHLRDEIMDVVVRDGDRDEKGNTVYSLPMPLEAAGKEWKGIKREARTSVVLNEERALEFAKRKGLDGVIEMVETIDLDALYVAHQQRQITEQELDGLFDTKTSYAFKPVSS
ncbi:hypothetical protein [Streptomyces luteogriseus]|uniref:hypothetical protein n=1 Tax=Streptomyces luteogriseus TaxID=68233 RepID=UPI00378D6931